MIDVMKVQMLETNTKPATIKEGPMTDGLDRHQNKPGWGTVIDAGASEPGTSA
jgi:hypothetical protein